MEPISTALAAFAAVQKAVSLIKTASKTAQDVASLGPLIGNYFDAKHTALKAVKETKREGGSNLGKAVEIELAIKAQADFEEQLKGLFFPNNMDVWESIQERVRQMDQEDKHAERAERERVKKAKEAARQKLEIAIVILSVVFLFGMVGFGVYMIRDHCKTTQCGYK